MGQDSCLGFRVGIQSQDSGLGFRVSVFSKKYYF
jgi:hypothetical protein